MKRNFLMFWIVQLIAVSFVTVALAEDKGADPSPKTLISNPVVHPRVIGDANLDGKVNEEDLKLISDMADLELSFDEYKKADINVDGIVDEKDINQIDDIIQGKLQAKDQQGDVNGDGKVNAADKELALDITQINIPNNNYAMAIYNCDTNNDGKMTKEDVETISKLIESEKAGKAVVSLNAPGISLPGEEKPYDKDLNIGSKYTALVSVKAESASEDKIAINYEVNYLSNKGLWKNLTAGQKSVDKLLSVNEAVYFDFTVPDDIQIGSKNMEVKWEIVQNDKISISPDAGKLSIRVGIAKAVAVSSKFKDLPETHWAYQAVMAMVKEGVVSGYGDGTFKPDSSVTRAEFTKMMVLSSGIKPVDSQKPTFVDVKSSDWAYPYIEAAKEYMDGYQTTAGYYYKPSENAIREDVACALVKAEGYQDTVVDTSQILKLFKDAKDISDLRAKYIIIAYQKGLISGYEDKTFKPKGTLTRAEAAKLLYNGLIKNSADVTKEKGK